MGLDVDNLNLGQLSLGRRMTMKTLLSAISWFASVQIEWHLSCFSIWHFHVWEMRLSAVVQQVTTTWGFHDWSLWFHRFPNEARGHTLPLSVCSGFRVDRKRLFTWICPSPKRLPMKRSWVHSTWLASVAYFLSNVNERIHHWCILCENRCCLFSYYNLSCAVRFFVGLDNTHSIRTVTVHSTQCSIAQIEGLKC